MFFSLKISFFVFFLGVCFTPVSVFAAQVFFKLPTSPMVPGQEFLAEVLVNTEGEQVNAIEGALFLPDSLVEVVDIQDGQSVINFWVEKPQRLGSEKIVFSGITPGGFTGDAQPLVSLLLRAKEPGLGNIHGNNFRVLRNDGLGTSIPTTINMAWISITSDGETTVSPRNMVEDREIPEKFTPMVVLDPNLFAGKYTLIFSTEDKGSGIDHYEIREGKRENFHTEESPYLLVNQSLDTDIYIKAVDNEGNERVVTLEGENKVHWYENYKKFGIIAILSVVGIFFLWLCLKFKRKS